MNANELADAIENIGIVTTPPLLKEKAATMLRQQQVEIKVLEEALGRALDLLGAPK